MRAVAALIAMLGASLAAAAPAAAPGAADTPPATQAAAPQSADTLVFDIPGLPLYQALQHYSRLTRRSVFYETSLIAQKQSTAIQGRYTRQAALDSLLQGTGLAARFTEHQSFVLMETPAPKPASRADAAETAALAQQRYDSRVQARIVQALCANPAIDTGSYRLALRFWVDDRDRIGRLQVHAAGHPELEPAIHAALAGLPVGAPPPGLAQPAVMLLTPEAALGLGGCRP